MIPLLVSSAKAVLTSSPQTIMIRSEAMKNIRIPFLLMTMFFISLLVGCKSEEDKAVGYWKSEKEIYHGTYSKLETIVIKKDSISIDGRDIIPIKLQSDSENGYIRAVRKNDEASTLLKIKPKDDNILEISSIMVRDDTYVRTTKEDVEAIIKSPGRKHEYEPVKLF